MWVIRSCESAKDWTILQIYVQAYSNLISNTNICNILHKDLCIRICYLIFFTTTIETVISTQSVITGHFNYIDIAASIAFSVFMCKVVTFQTRCITNAITVAVITVILGNTITALNSRPYSLYIMYSH